MEVRKGFLSPESVLRAKSLALVGASERSRWPRDIYGSLRKYGFPGQIYLVNPRQSAVYGETAYSSLRELPEPVDHAIVIVPGMAVADVLEDAAARGISSATVYAGGVGDGEGEVSQRRGARVREIIARTQLRIAGPNCMGGFSYREKLFAYPNPRLADLSPGPVSCVFQSGGTLQFFMSTAAERGLRFSYCYSSGNELDLDLADYLNWLVDEPQTRQIVLFIEGIRRPKAFMSAAGRALAAGKPIIAIKTGASEGSARAAASHTGAIAGDYATYLAMCERYGIINCNDLDELVETTLAFQCNRRPKGPRVGWVTTSGGTVDLLHDCIERNGTELSQFSAATNEAILPYMQEGISPKNPLDVGIPSNLKNAADLCALIAADPNVDILAWSNQLPATRARWGDVEHMRAMMEATDKPVIGFARMAYQMKGEAHALQEEIGFPFLQGLPATCRALNALWFHAQRAGQHPPLVEDPAVSTLDEASLAATLAGYGIEGPRSALVADAAEAVAAAQRIGYPVVLKIRSPDILHKTEAGGVVLDLRDADGVARAAQSLMRSAKASYPDARIDGFLVQEMVSGLEAIAGAREDELYGPVLLAGSGGVLVELIEDVTLSMLPVDTKQVANMIDRLKLAKLLAGFRGRPAADRAALEDAILSLGRFFLDHRSKIDDIEINPLIVRDNGKGVCAVDVRVIWKSA